MNETLGNLPEARTPTGEIRSAPTVTIEETPKPETPPAPAAATPTTPIPTDTTKKAEGANEGTGEKTLLNEEGKKPEPAKLTGAPEKYGDFSAPEGYEFRSETMEGANKLFKELDLSQAGAQRLVDFHAAELKAVLEAPQKLWQETREKWLNEVKSDPEIGGKLDQVKATVARAIDGLGDPKLASEFRQAMDYTGAGNNPAFIRAFYKLAQKVTEGTVVSGGGPVEVKAPGQGLRTMAQALYPNLK